LLLALATAGVGRVPVIGPATLGVHRAWARERRLTSGLPSAVEAEATLAWQPAFFFAYGVAKTATWQAKKPAGRLIAA
jgi:hypothetical protein